MDAQLAAISLCRRWSLGELGLQSASLSPVCRRRAMGGAEGVWQPRCPTGVGDLCSDSAFWTGWIWMGRPGCLRWIRVPASRALAGHWHLASQAVALGRGVYGTSVCPLRAACLVSRALPATAGYVDGVQQALGRRIGRTTS